MLAYCRRTGFNHLQKYVWYGTGLGILLATSIGAVSPLTMLA